MVSATWVEAYYLEVSMEAQVRAAPNSNADVLETLHAGDEARVLNRRVQENGYYKLKTHNQVVGWVYRNRVRLRTGNLPDWSPSTASSMAGFDGEKCKRHLLFGVPHQSDLVLCRDGYATGYNLLLKIPDWSAYFITYDSVHGANFVRSDYFFDDPDVTADHRSLPSDYAGSGFDRGHLAPSAAIDFTRQANNQTFFYSNMTPQLPGFNRNMMGHTGVWGAVEDKVRRWVRDRNELYIIAGTHVSDPPDSMGGGVAVPAHFFKIIVDPATLETLAFWMPQDLNTAHQMNSYLKSIDEIEVLTGFDFLSRLTDPVESLIEAQVPTAVW